MTFDGLGLHLGNLSRLADAETRSISPENFTGAKAAGGLSVEGTASAAARDLGVGWKVSPYVRIPAGTTFDLADIEGPGAIQQIWLTVGNPCRELILRIYWDNQEHPSVECPVGDFFALGWGGFAQVTSLPICVNPGNALNSYWEMPFRARCRMMLSNISNDEKIAYYQINYTLTTVPEDAAYFHAQFRRVNPLPYKDIYTILDGVEGQGHYVGTYVAWGANNDGWWGEGEVKFFLDGDGEFPTICTTGTEDYFCGSYCFMHNGEYIPYTTPYAGMPQVIRPDGKQSLNARFGMYRWHIMDPIRFRSDLRVTMQALGWRPDRRYLPLQDDIASVACWYQTLPSAPFPELPERDYLEII